MIVLAALPRLRRALAATTAASLLATALLTGTPGAAAADDGRRAKGGTDANSAAEVSPGDWWDELGPAGTDQGVRVYLVDRGEPNGGVAAGISLEPQAAVEDGIEVKLIHGSEVCNSDRDQTYGSSVEPQLNVLAEVSARVRSSEACASAQRLVLTVARTNGTDTRRIRLRVTQTPAVANVDNYPKVEPTEAGAALTVASTTEGEPGTWLGDAGTLESGRAVASSIGAHQRHTYRIGVRWGQTLRWMVVFPEASPSVREQIEKHGVTAHSWLVNPMGGAGAATEAYSLHSGSDISDRTPTQTAYNSTQRNNMQGQYVLVVQTLGPDGVELAIPYQLVAVVEGEVRTNLGPDVPLEGPVGAVGGGIEWLPVAVIGLGVVLAAAGGLVLYAARGRR
ncbi:hypothetical protein [Aestuariimicrobium ganziense]|uniref:hypothetical protein n=1 Tax=Aestuariimicrobium ganziense TaxID=2773677 RepID=UPI00194599BA|nr:hypothetical protein [Aestuariimicrobium ganziense]